ncbi:MAG: ATP phosphoribosyltransferase regulatory subunit [Epsilonproteobacteria bacterium]|nr:ATP phosphoribosyltransferase regulatory subunit [Campylobacterota bacterium]NPA63762.1 ATP phosphoribosyltransferase regulatory subunit [Campylobacterota bacterium]
MIYEHEIPKGARLYFGASARKKREIEGIASALLYKEGFEEIVTPLFSYHQHNYIEDESELIHIFDEKNRKLTIRADSTVDVVRIITKRLGRSVEHKRWFYIQPVYRYPSKEYYQIGAEILDSKDAQIALRLVKRFFDQIALEATLQISNIKIPKLLAQRYGVDLEILKRIDLDRILQIEHEWMEPLLHLSSPEQIDDLLGLVPEDIEAELVKMKELALCVLHEDVILSPLYYADMRYYKDLFFRFFRGNVTLAMGGEYEAAGLEACGFAIYIDEVIHTQKVADGS